MSMSCWCVWNRKIHTHIAEYHPDFFDGIPTVLFCASVIGFYFYFGLGAQGVNWEGIFFCLDLSILSYKVVFQKVYHT